jgi:neutral trehalase
MGQNQPVFDSEEQLIAACRQTLRENDREGGFTVPTAKLYPFQWLWDAGFIALGWATFDFERALLEIESLHSAQWSNGFVPHIIFHHPNDGYFPGPAVHGADLSPFAPAHVATTGMTQPPVIGFILEKMYHRAGDKKQIQGFLETHFEKTYQFHEYLYTHRDPQGEGLVYIQHNWESGTDNSPVWDEIWKTFDAPNYELPRRDIQHINADQRPTHRDYEYYIYLIEIFKKLKYDDAAIARESPFLVQDPLFNSMLAASNESLARLGSLIGASKAQIRQLKRWHRATRKAMNQKLWSKQAGGYLHYDLRNERLIPALTSSSFAPLFAGIPTQQKAKRLLKTLFSERFRGKAGEQFLCPSFNVQDARFNPKKYWRGPVWVNMNWLIYNGLLRYGFEDAAQIVRQDTLDLVKKYGLWEYFNPARSAMETETAGYGAPNFSWTAALILDFLN